MQNRFVFQVCSAFYLIMRYLTLGILAHVDAGKTTLSESMLFNSGAIRNAGRVDHKDAFLDTYDIEKERGITVFSKQAVLDYGGIRMVLVDTPGHADFTSETERTFAILDAAVLVISSLDGVTGHTRFLFERLKRFNIPTFIFFNKMDMAGSDRGKLLDDIRHKLNGSFVDMSSRFDDPAFLEEIALTDEGLMEKYLEGLLVISNETMSQIVSDCRAFPCYFGSALKNEGVRELMEGLSVCLTEKKYPESKSMRIFKIASDDKNNRLTFAKITGGSYEVKETVPEYDEKIEQIRIYSGKSYETVKTAESGMIVAFAGLSKSLAGDHPGEDREIPASASQPVLKYKVISKKHTDPVVLLGKLRKLEEEDPSLNVTWEEEKKEILIRLMGQVQLEVISRLMIDRFDEPVDFDTGSIVYKETITDRVEGMGHFEPLRHYAEVHLILEPAEEGSGIIIDNVCDSDQLSKNWQNLILTHLSERKFKGKLTGSELTDVKITLAAGKAHLKHTEGGDFRQATYRAVRNGTMKSGAVLLEPWYSFSLSVPEYAVGRAMTELGTKGASFELSETMENGLSVIKGIIPASEAVNYADEVRKYTKGEGVLELEFSGYKPCHNTDEITEKYGYDPERDLRNTGDSVFCEHGAGVVIPWYEADERMHLPPVLSTGNKTEESNIRRGGSFDKRALSIDEIDSIIERTYYSNRKKGSGSFRNTRSMIYESTLGDTADVVKGESSPRNDRYKKRDNGLKKKPEYTLIDGYNVIFAWEELKALGQLNIDSARDSLLDIMCNYRGLIDSEIIVVFDAYRVKGHGTEFLDFNNIHVVYTKEAQTADSYIERFAHENADHYDVTVVTSDSTEQVIVLGKGCRVHRSDEFRNRVIGVISDAARDFSGREKASVNSMEAGFKEKIELNPKD